MGQIKITSKMIQKHSYLVSENDVSGKALAKLASKASRLLSRLSSTPFFLGALGLEISGGIVSSMLLDVDDLRECILLPR